jgi:hypothetical protein
VLLIGLAAACNKAPAGPSALDAAASGNGNIVATYAATLAASPACADRLPADARVRRFVATLNRNDSLRWSSPTVDEPGGHAQRSSGHLDGSRFSLVIGTKEDPQSDAFHGITEILAGAGIVNIAGTGTGSVKDGQITGTFEGEFNFYHGHGDGTVDGIFCSAADHSFVLSPQATPPADEISTVTGFVLDDTSWQPLVGAVVEWAGLAEAWGDEGHGVFTDAAGRYVLQVSHLGGPGAAEGVIVMRATRERYVPLSKQVTLVLGGRTTVDFRLVR